MNDKEIKSLLRTIPKEHKPTINKLLAHYYQKGIKDVQALIMQVAEIPSESFNEYGVWHDSSIDGG